MMLEIIDLSPNFHFLKMIEKIVHNRISSHLENNNLMNIKVVLGKNTLQLTLHLN